MVTATVKKPERLRTVLEKVSLGLSKNKKLPRMVAISTTMAIALALAEHEFRYEKGLMAAYTRLLYKMVPTLASILRSARSELSSEFSSLLRKGPTLYYAEATTRLQKLQVEEE